MATRLESLQDWADLPLPFFIDSPVPTGIMEVDTLRILAVNEACVTNYGYSREEWLQMTAADLRPADQTPRLLEVLATVGETWTPLGEWIHIRKDRSQIEVELVAKKIRFAGRDARVIAARDVTEHNRAKRALSDSQRRLASILEGLNDPFFCVDEDWNLLYVNRHGERLIGRRADEIIGRSVWSEFPMLANAWFAPICRKVMADRIPIHIEPSADDGTFFEIDVTPMASGIAITYRDISERKRDEARRRFLMDLSDQIRSEASPVEIKAQVCRALGTFLGSARCAYADYDESNATLTVEQEYVVDAPSAEGSYPIEQIGLVLAEQLAAGETLVVCDVERDYRVATAREILEPLSIRSFIAVPLQKAGRLTSILTVSDSQPRMWSEEDRLLVTQVSDRTWHAVENAHSQEEVRRLNRSLEDRVALRTAELLAAKDELEGFCYSVSHDLRAPLRAIISSAMILIEDHRDSLEIDAQDQLRRMGMAANRMGQLIDDLLQFSRLGRKEMEPERINLSSIAQIVVSELRAAHPASQVEFRIADGLWAHGDGQMMQLVLRNLLENGHKFSAQSPSPCVHFGQDELSFFVRDNGIGFEPQFVHKLFRPFERLHALEHYPGTGIGLANVKRIIERHGGRVWADGKPGEGAIFRFTVANSETFRAPSALT